MSSLTIGVAIAVPEPAATELHKLRSRAGDPQADIVPPHVTLLPPTLVEPILLPDIEKHLATVAADHPAFVMRLAGPGTFLPVSRVVFAQVSQGLANCELLEAGVRSGVLTGRAAYPFHPHVTIAHEMPDAQLDRAYESLRGYEAQFGVDEFSMFEQDAHGAWQVRCTFALTGESA